MLLQCLLVLLVTCPFGQLFEIQVPRSTIKNPILLDVPRNTEDKSDSLSDAIKVTNASNHFGLALYHVLSRSGNLFISPFSLSAVLTMTYLGAQDTTAQQMSSVLGYRPVGLKSAGVLNGLQEATNLLNSQENGYDLEIANAVLVQRSFNVLKSYRQALTRELNATLQEVDFQTEGEKVVNEVNSWASHRTKNKIQNLLTKPLPSNSRLALLNAVYFKGTWQTMFDKKLTKTGTFYNNGLIPTRVNMMEIKTKFKFFNDPNLDVYAIEMPYTGHHMSMLILLPHNRNGLPALERALSVPYLENVYATLQEKNVFVRMPQFKLEEKYEDIKRTLQALGMSDVFDEQRANLAGITGHRDLYLNKVVHKTHVEVNEEGSVATAVSFGVSIVRIGGNIAPQFVIDHPFIFLIRDSRTGLILFIGRVAEL
ncbi:leukocyte elastase inhibitor C-like [Limulus polyphemus]|uniref:Leukocyte elastase inhibitor C-like n=1 Tax=Limulus polyphemus TaxID=6850 RepID=A0ABM1B819_LIMPO|nr:leukocyte elastase inhibitor C-like [Limulus polyphemus]